MPDTVSSNAASTPTVDNLEKDFQGLKISVQPVIMPAEIRSRMLERQLPLCMIGDSVTWAGEGDYFRHFLLQEIPELAFIGTHTATLGYSHAGEGGDTTERILDRIEDPVRIPDAPYYHLLAGINDCARSQTEQEIDGVAQATVQRLHRILANLLSRKRTRKVFLATILPGPFPPNEPTARTLRDRTGERANEYLRQELATRYPDGRVILIEYEKPLREMGIGWRQRMNGAHPNREGYQILAKMAAPILRREMAPEFSGATAVPGVEVVNLWDRQSSWSAPIIPGWYVLSFKVVSNSGGMTVTLKGKSDVQFPFEKTFEVAEGVTGERVQYMFMTGYAGYTYTISPFTISVSGGEIDDILLEKMRPSGKASIFGEGHYIDTESPIAFGERMA